MIPLRCSIWPNKLHILVLEVSPQAGYALHFSCKGISRNVWRLADDSTLRTWPIELHNFVLNVSSQAGCAFYFSCRGNWGVVWCFADHSTLRLFQNDSEWVEFFLFMQSLLNLDIPNLDVLFCRSSWNAVDHFQTLSIIFKRCRSFCRSQVSKWAPSNELENLKLVAKTS